MSTVLSYLGLLYRQVIVALASTPCSMMWASMTSVDGEH